MPLSQFLQSPVQMGHADYMRQAVQDVQNQQLANMKIKDTAAEQENKRRSLAISMLNGIANEPDQMKQAELYTRLKPMAERYDPTLKLPDQYDPSLTRALSASQISPTDIMNDQRIRENAQLMNQYRNDQLAMRDQQAQEAAQAKAEQQAQLAADRGANTYSQRVDQAGLAELLPAVNNTVDMLSPYANGQDVPGFGGVAGMLPDWAVSQQGKDLRQAYAGVRNAVLKARSGGAVTPQESERLLQELGEGTMLPDEQVIKGMANVSNFLKDRIANLQAGVTPQAIDTYKQRGGTVTKEAVKTLTQQSNEPRLAPDGNYYIPDPNRPGKYLMVQP